MSRPRSYSRAEMLDRAMSRFWHHGLNGSSIGDLVTATGVSRHGLYAEFGDKRGLLLAAFASYRAGVVDPAVAPMEACGATFADIRGYFERQIGLAEAVGLPGPGCLFANALTEIASHDAEVAGLVRAHLDRLTRAFGHAMCQDGGGAGPAIEADARALTAFAQGLWSMSRVVAEADTLRRAVDAVLAPLGQRGAA